MSDSAELEAAIGRLDAAVTALDEAVRSSDRCRAAAAFGRLILAIKELYRLVTPGAAAIDAEIEEMGHAVVGGASAADFAALGRQILERVLKKPGC